MGANSKIEWTDHTFNPWIGCSKVHRGCEHCYAEAFAKRTGTAQWGVQGTRVKTSENNWREPLKWNRAAAAAGVRARVFCASLADVFEEWAGPIHDHHGDYLYHGGDLLGMDDLRQQLFALIDATPWLDWLLLTKRPEHIRRMWVSASPAPLRETAGRDVSQGRGERRENVALLYSASNQETLEQGIGELLSCRDLVHVLGLSLEPLVGPIDLKPRPPELRGTCIVEHRHDGTQGSCQTRGIDWVIVGGESGHHADPLHPAWARSLRDQCQAAGVPFFFKQWGEWAEERAAEEAPATRARQCLLPSGQQVPLSYGSSDGAAYLSKVGKVAAGRLLDEREWSELPRFISQET